MSNELVNNVIAVVGDHKKIANQNGELFNIFNILKVRRSEIKTHSRFINELLRPDGSHGEGAKFTQLFIETICPSLPLATSYLVKREDRTSEAKRIDFTIESTGKFIIGIEMKIDAEDQTEQLYNYHQELKRRTNSGTQIELIYLTLDGRNASASSLKTICKNTPSETELMYLTASFKDHILDWLDKCITEVTPKKYELIAAIKQYVHLIESITGVSKTLRKQTSLEITKSVDTFSAALEIENSLRPAKVVLQEKFWTELIRQLEEKKIPLKWVAGKKSEYTKLNIKQLATNYYNLKQNSRPLAITHLIGQKSVDKEEYKFNFCIRLWDAIHYGITIEKVTQASPDLNNKVKQAWRSEFKDIYTKYHGSKEGKAIQNPDWLLCYYNSDGGEAINLFEFNNALSRRVCLEEGLLSTKIGEIIQHQLVMMDFINKKILEKDEY